MLEKRGMTPLGSIAEYRSVFCFPIAQYYRNVGFDFASEPFEDLAQEFIGLYHADKSGNSSLFSGAEAVLSTIYKQNITQIVLSTSQQCNLTLQMSEFDIGHYFDEVLGLGDIYAKSKIDLGVGYMERNGTKNTLLIGDTTHDYEVAKTLGVDCILVANGHQNRETLLSCNVDVLDDISCTINYI